MDPVSSSICFFFKTKLWSKIASNVFHKTIKFVEVPTAVKSSAWATNFLIFVWFVSCGISKIIRISGILALAYVTVAVRSLYLAPSVDFISQLPIINNDELGNPLITNVTIAGHIFLLSQQN